MKDAKGEHGAYLPDQPDDEWFSLYNEPPNQVEEVPNARGITHIAPIEPSSKPKECSAEAEHVAEARGEDSNTIQSNRKSADIPPIGRLKQVALTSESHPVPPQHFESTLVESSRRERK